MKEMAWARIPMLPRLKDRDHKGTYMFYKLLKRFFYNLYNLYFVLMFLDSMHNKKAQMFLGPLAKFMFKKTIYFRFKKFLK